MKRYVTLLRELLAPAPAAPVDDDAPIVHRGEHELCAGFDHLGEDRDPPRKLSADEVERMCGRPLRVLG
ncbi:hypothetical protein ACFZ8E_25065 [Methylobacterium sp. HMF5984]|uniref:hypothetical protein n=1 Tax=Methylobacterium sp. HMF5984 TaxID=3367370 RepID=UPI0038525B36